MMTKLRIFAASPSDTAAERAKVETVASMLEPFATHLDIVLKVDDWTMRRRERNESNQG
jgi:hypothetical protein